METTLYSLILTGIGFIYVGFSGTDSLFLFINSLQAVVFLLLAYYGIVKNTKFLVIGYFLHGLWDLGYDLFLRSDLLPPHYDLFCLSLDFTVGVYLAIHYRRNSGVKYSI